jgi:hypothetical protein
MIPLMELLMQGGNGAAMDAIARQMGISRAEAERAAEALMPAFSQGLKRNVADPAGFMRFMAGLASGGYANYFDDPAKAASLNGIQQGDAILANLFGSKEVSRAIAAQAAQATGYSQALLKQMLPMLAPILLGGMFKQMSDANTASAQGNPAANPLGRILEQMMGGGGGYTGGNAGGGFGGGSGNPWGQILEEMMRGGQPRGQEATGRGAPQAGENPFGKMLEEMLGGARGGTAKGGAPSQYDNPLGDIFNEMLRGGGSEPEPDSEDTPRPQVREKQQDAPGKTYRPPRDGDPQPSTKGGLEDLFGQMFETGRATQREYQRGVEQIFDQFLGNKKSGAE